MSGCKGPFFRGLAAIDIQGSACRENPYVIARMHAGLYEIMQDAIDGTGTGWGRCHHADRGDGMIVVTPADSVGALAESLAACVWRGVRAYNRSASWDAAMRVRLALHAGMIYIADDGGAGALLGSNVNLVFRLLDASAFKLIAAQGGGELALAMSDYLYMEVARFGTAQPAGEDFTELVVENKETHTRAWTWVSPPSASANRQVSGDLRFPPEAGTGDGFVEAVPDLFGSTTVPPQGGGPVEQFASALSGLLPGHERPGESDVG